MAFMILSKKKFRDGEAEDYVSFTTKTNYVPYDENNTEQCEIKAEIDDFFYKVFPNDELREYMWQHAASSLIGDK